MQRFFRGVKLRNQLIILVAISVSVIVFTEIISIGVIRANNERQYEALLESSVHKIRDELDLFSGRINRIAMGFSFHEVTRVFLQNPEMYTEIAAANNVGALGNTICLTDGVIRSVILTDLDRVIIGATGREDFNAVERLSALRSEGKLSADAPVHLTLPSDTAGEVAFICVVSSFVSALDKQFYTVVRYGDDFLASAVSSPAVPDGYRFSVSDSAGNRLAGNVRGALSTVSARTGNGWLVSGGYQIKDGDLLLFQRFSYFFITAVVLILVASAAVIYQNITKPVTKLAGFMKAYDKASGDARISLGQDNEIGVLAKAVNAMLDEIDKMTEKNAETLRRLYMTELAEQNARLESLQLQMNPHFLSNTLECIRGVALEREVPEISAIISSLARIFRYSLEESMTMTLRDEVNCVVNYMQIINVRKGGVYDVSYELEEKALDNRVIKMLLQPLVENAVAHGLENRKNGGALTLRAECVGTERIRVTIADNGMGMPADVLERLNTQLASKDLPPLTSRIHGLGVLNSNQRLRLTYGEDYGLRLESEEGVGTTVIIEIPADGRAIDS